MTILDMRNQFNLPLGLGPPSLPITSTGASRSYTGNTLEEIVRKLCNLDQGPRNGSDSTCPDALSPSNGWPVEIKSLKRGSKLVVYDWRLKKDLPNTIYFIGIRHPDRLGASKDLYDIWTRLSNALYLIVILTLEEVREMAIEFPLQKIKTFGTKRNGYSRKGYCEGYRSIPFSRLLSSRLIQMPFLLSARIHNLDFQASVKVSEKTLLDLRPEDRTESAS